MRLIRTFARAKTLSVEDWAVLGEASVALLRARVAFAHLSPQEMIGHLSKDRPDAHFKTVPETDLSRLAWAIAAAANRAPWQTDCLVRCLAAKRMLDRRKLESRFHIGVTKPDDGSLSAHAWMLCGTVSIAGGDGAEFVPLISPETAEPTP